MQTATNTPAQMSTPATNLPRYMVMTAAAQKPGNCWGNYRRVAVVETDDSGISPRMISRRALGVYRIVARWEMCSVGKTSRCAYEMALAAARELVAELTAAN